MPETRFIEFPALSVNPWVGFSRSASETDVSFYLTMMTQTCLRMLKKQELSEEGFPLLRNKTFYRMGKIKSIIGPMQTEKSQPEGKWIMPETRFTEFPALSVYPETDDDYFSYILLNKIVLFP